MHKMSEEIMREEKCEKQTNEWERASRA